MSFLEKFNLPLEAMFLRILRSQNNSIKVKFRSLQLTCVNQLIWISREKLTSQARTQVYADTHKLRNLFLSKLGKYYVLLGTDAYLTPKPYSYTPYIQSF